VRSRPTAASPLRRLLVATALVGALLAPVATAPAEADPLLVPDPLQLIDVETGLECTELVPHAIALVREELDLHVRVLLDGVGRKVAREAVRDMRRAYTPIDIDVRATYERVSFTTRDAAELNARAKRHYGGERPPGVDVVYTMTSKDVTSTGPTGGNVAGLADCIGGIRFPDRAFAVGERIADGPGSLLGVPVPLPLDDATGKTMAHEIGHLLGAHHHYFSPEGLLAEDPNVGSLMGPTLSIIALRFSTLNALMVQGHLQEYGVSGRR
jgi:hypothetical protein